MTKNEVRQIVGMKPSDDPKADELLNSNISRPASEENFQPGPEEIPEEGYEDYEE